MDQGAEPAAGRSAFDLLGIRIDAAGLNDGLDSLNEIRIFQESLSIHAGDTGDR
jgi:hypothetical protein